ARVTALAPDQSTVSSTDRSYHFGAAATLTLEKAVNAADPWHPTVYEDADYAAGVVLRTGATVTWTYLVKNTGDVAVDLTGVTDDGGVAGDIAFLATSVNTIDSAFNDGDVNKNSMLDPGETWLFVATGTVVAGAYKNTATATGVFRVAGIPTTV